MLRSVATRPRASVIIKEAAYTVPVVMAIIEIVKKKITRVSSQVRFAIIVTSPCHSNVLSGAAMRRIIKTQISIKINLQDKQTGYVKLTKEYVCRIKFGQHIS